jgi:hypothetical protein
MARTPMGTQAADQILSSVATPTDRSSSAPARPDQDDDPERLRGVIALPRRRNILLSDEVALDAGTLPHWRPDMMVDERRLTDDEPA